MAMSRRGAWCASSLLLALLVALVVNAARLPPDAAPSTIASVDKAGEQIDGIEWPHRRTKCEDIDFRKSSLKLIKEMPFIGLFEDLKGQAKFEASGMTTAKGWLWVVFDSLRAIGRVDEHFEFRGHDNILVGQEDGTDSQFEGLTYVASRDSFITVVEAHDDEHHGLVPLTEEVVMSKDGKDYAVRRRCPVHFTLSHENKGFEGLHYHEDAAKGQHYLFGLCEGNYCKGGRLGRDSGNGRIIVSEFREGDDEGSEYDCHWEVIKEVHIPSAADFIDYSGMAFNGDKVAIISQENSALWLGTFDFDSLEFVESADAEGLGVDGRTFHFPRNAACDMIYCNVEGIQWLDDDRLVIVSDKAKRAQPYWCTIHDQMLSLFALPA